MLYNAAVRWTRLSVLIFILYLAADLSDPSIPGIFFFEMDQLFVDTVVETSAGPTTDAVTIPTVPPPLPGALVDEDKAVTTPSRPARAVLVAREPRHDLSYRSPAPEPSSPLEPH